MNSDEEINRVKRSKEEAKVSYDKMSSFYDTLAKPEKKYIYRGLEMLGVRDGAHVLEIGFGTGDAILKLAESVGASGQVYGIDISEGMLEVTMSKLDKSELSDRVKLVLGDAMELPFGNESFNAVFMSFTLELFDTPEIPLILQECRRVLDKEGKLGVVALSDKREDNLMTKLYKWVHLKIPSYVDCRPILTEKELINVDFKIEEVEMYEMWGLPIDIVISKK
jgi:ubiquinone/menaquinone biosynthesis C-methylase UbiE